MNKQQQSHFDQTPGVRLDMHVTRFGLRLAASLTQHSETLPHDVSERLRFAREQALLKARSARALQTAAAPGTVLVQSGATLALGRTGSSGSSGGNSPEGSSPRWLKLVSFMPLLLLVVGMLVIQHSQWYEQITAAAEIDTALLSDNLPPAAYGDPGFSEYLSDDQE